MIKSIRLVFLTLLTSAFVAACGGSSSSSSTTNALEKYAGHYTGSVAGDPGHEKNAGPLEITITTDGKITGTCTVNGYPQVLSGTINASGDVAMEMRFAENTEYHSMNMVGKWVEGNITGTSREIYTPEVTGTWQAKKD